MTRGFVGLIAFTLSRLSLLPSRDSGDARAAGCDVSRHVVNQRLVMKNDSVSSFCAANPIKELAARGQNNAVLTFYAF